MITRLRAPTSARPRLAISSSTRSSSISPADRHGDVARRLEAAHRLLELLAAVLAGLVQARVVDRHGRPVGEDHRRLLVALGELAVLLLGQVEVAPRLAADRARARRGSRASPDARWGSRSCAGWRRRRPGAAAAAARSARRARPGRGAGRRSRGGPARRSPTVRKRASSVRSLVEDPERRVARAGDLAGGLEHAVEHDGEVELGHQRAADLEQAARAICSLASRSRRDGRSGRRIPMSVTAFLRVPVRDDHLHRPAYAASADRARALPLRRRARKQRAARLRRSRGEPRARPSAASGVRRIARHLRTPLPLTCFSAAVAAGRALAP